MTLSLLNEEATDVMIPLKQECADQGLGPASPASQWHTKACCLQGGLSRAVRLRVLWRQHWFTQCCAVDAALVCSMPAHGSRC